MTPLRIAAHISAAEWGGAERRSLALLAALAQRGHHVVVYCTTERIAEKTREHGLEVVIAPLRGDIRIDNALAFARRLRRFRPDVLLLITFRRLLLGAIAGRLAGVPRIIARVGASTDVARSAKYRFVLKHWIDDAVLNAHSIVQPFRASLPDGARVRVTVITNGVDARPAILTRAQARRRAGIPDDAFVVGTVTRLVRGKGLETMLDTMAMLPQTYAVITGAGALEAPLRERAAVLGVSERVVFTGAREDVGDLLRALDVYVVTSDKEGMSNAMLEALAAGLPVVSTPVSGAAEALLGDPACGVVVERTPRAIADAIDALRLDESLRARLGAAAARVAATRYSMNAMVTSWERLLSDPE